jgi:hypothetical protein
MKFALTLFTATVTALGLVSNVQGQQLPALHGFETMPSADTPSSILQVAAEEPGSIAKPPVSTDDFPEPMTSFGTGCGDNAPCCSDQSCCCNDCCCNGSSGWDVKFVPYFWLTEMHGNATLRGVTNPVHISSRDLLDIIEHNAHFLFAGSLEAEQKQGPFGAVVNAYYLNAGLSNAVERFNFDSNFKMAIIEMAAAYKLEGAAEALSLPPCSKVNLLLGGRYWMLKGAGTITGPLNNSVSFDLNQQWVDPLIGGIIRVPLNCYSSFNVRGDVGGFGWGTASDFAWNLAALVEMRYDCCTLRAGYRVLDVDQERGQGNQRFALDVQFRGPVTELVFTF